MASLASDTYTDFPSSVSIRKQSIITKTYTRSTKPKETLGLYDSGGEIPVELEHACRLCLDETEMMVYIFTDHADLPIAKKITSILDLDISKGDALPSTICTICLRRLDEAYNFKKQCVATDKKLRQFLLKEPQTSEEPCTSSFIEQIDDYCPVLTKEECTLELDDWSPLAIMYQTNEPLRPKRTIDCPQQSKKTADKPPCITIVDKLPTVPISDFVDELEEDVDDPLSTSPHKPSDKPNDKPSDKPNDKSSDKLSDKSSEKPCSSGNVYPRPTPEKPVNNLPNGKTITLKTRNCGKNQFIKKVSLTFPVHRPRGRKPQAIATPCKTEPEDNRSIEIIKVDLDDVPLKDRMALEESQPMNHCLRCNSMVAFPMRDHIQECVASHRCSFCQKAFPSPSLLSRHSRVHTGEKPYECSHCDMAFTQKESLIRHFFSQHGKKTFMCPLCDKAFAAKFLLSSHMINVHERKKRGLKYACDLCDKKFFYSSGLSRHQNAHNGTKFHCKICARPFTDHSAIVRHLKKAHLGT